MAPPTKQDKEAHRTTRVDEGDGARRFSEMVVVVETVGSATAVESDLWGGIKADRSVLPVEAARSATAFDILVKDSEPLEQIDNKRADALNLVTR